MRARTRGLVIMASQGIAQATTLALGVILVRIISQEDLGEFRQVLLAYAVIASVISLQMGNSLYYFVPKLPVEEWRSLLAQTLAGTVAMSGVVAVMMLVCADYVAEAFGNPALAPLIRGFAVYPFIDRLSELVAPFLISVDRAVAAGVYSTIVAVSRSAVVVVVIALGGSLSEALWSFAATQGVVAAVGCVMIIRLCPRGSWRLNWRLVIDQLSYTWPLWTTVVVAMASTQLDKLVISVFYDSASFAVYSTGAFELPVVGLVTVSVATAIMPNLVVMVSQGRVVDALGLWQDATRKCSLLVFPAFVYFLVVSHDFIVLFFGEQYEMASWPFGIFLFILPFRVASFVVMFRAMGKTGPIAVAAVVGLVGNAVLSAGLAMAGRGTLLGYLGPSLGAVFAVVLVAGYFTISLSRQMRMPVAKLIRWFELGHIMAASSIAGIVAFLVPLGGASVLVSLVVRGGAFVAIFSLVAFLSKLLKPDEVELLRMPLSAVQKLLRR